MRGGVEQVDRRWRLGLVWVHDDEAVATVGGQHVEQVADQVALGRVERGHPTPSLDIVEDHVLQQHRLTGTGGATDVDVMPAVRQGDPDPHAGAGVRYADDFAAQAVPLVGGYQIEALAARLRRAAGVGVLDWFGRHGALHTVGGLSSLSLLSGSGDTRGLAGVRRGRRELPTAGVK